MAGVHAPMIGMRRKNGRAPRAGHADPVGCVQRDFAAARARARASACVGAAGGAADDVTTRPTQSRYALAIEIPLRVALSLISTSEKASPRGRKQTDAHCYRTSHLTTGPVYLGPGRGRGAHWHTQIGRRCPVGTLLRTELPTHDFELAVSCFHHAPTRNHRLLRNPRRPPHLGLFHRK